MSFLLYADPAPTCEFYVGSVCYGMGAIGNDYVYVDNSDTSQQDLDSRLMRLNSTLQTKMSLDIPHYCDDMILTLMCHNSFQLCDHNSTTPVPRRVSDRKCIHPYLFIIIAFYRSAGPIVKQ